MRGVIREEFINFIECLELDGLPFFLFKRAGQNHVVSASQTDDTLHKQPHDKLTNVVFNKFLKSESQYFIHSEVVNDFTFDFESVPNTSRTPSIDFEDQAKHINLVNTAIDFLKRGPADKVVVSRNKVYPRIRAKSEVFVDLVQAYPDANVYYFYHPKVGRWMGATPELLFSISQKTLTTMSLAGTALADLETPHKWGEKELFEQQVVTDYIKTQLTNINGLQGVSSLPLETIQAGHLLHLRTIITASVISDDFDVQAVLDRLHPTPAVCGYPTAIARDFIEQHEGYDREFYTGYFGMYNQVDGHHEYYVNLRCMQLMNDQCILYAGGGITVDSDARAEFMETQSKLQTMAAFV